MTERQPIYQVDAAGGGWVDVAEKRYVLAHPDMRRIVYLTPHPDVDPHEMFKRFLSKDPDATSGEFQNALNGYEIIRALLAATENQP